MWLEVLKDVLLGAAATCALTSCLADKPAMASVLPTPPPVSRPAPPVRRGNASEYRIEARITDGNRCIVRGSINGQGKVDLLADSGAPDMWFPVGDLPKLGIARSGLDFRPFGAREGNVAWVTLDKVQIGDFVARNVEAAIADGKEFHWRLLGMSVLKQGHMEIHGDNCTLTFPRNAAGAMASVPVSAQERASAQCSQDSLSKLNAYSLDRTCRAECSETRMCQGATGRLAQSATEPLRTDIQPSPLPTYSPPQRPPGWADCANGTRRWGGCN